MMRKLAIATTAVALILGLGASAASADERHGWKSPTNRQTVHEQTTRHQWDRRGEVRRRGPATEVVRVGVHRRFFDERIPLRRLLNLDRDYRGYRIQSVTVKVRPNRTRARLALLANGQVVDRARASHTRRIELTPSGERTLGRDLNRLQLAVRGRAYIDSIQVKLQAPRHDRRGRGVYRTSHDPRARTPDVTEQVVRIILGQIDLADGNF
jgi:hypothetical protein